MSKFDGKFWLGNHKLTGAEIASLDLETDELRLVRLEMERQLAAPSWTAQPHLMPPARGKNGEEPWRTWILRCGRASGKTWALQDLILSICVEEYALHESFGVPFIPDARILLICATFNDAVHTIVRPFVDRCLGVPGPILKSVNFTSGLIVFNSGAEIRFIGSDSPDRPRGMSVHCTVGDELAAWTSSEVWENAQLATRLPLPNGDPGFLVAATTPRLKKWLKPIFEAKNAITTTATPSQNLYLTQGNKDAIYGLYKVGSLRYRLEILGEAIYSSDDALFDQDDWKVLDVDDMQEADRKLIVLDPALKIGKDDTGLMVIGRSGLDVQVIEDYSSNSYGPNEVIEKLNQAIEEHPDATDILVEDNAAGNWLKKVLLGADLPIHIIYVRANKSKASRAEQAVVMSEQGRMQVAKHLAEGAFGEELALWSPSTSNFSPGRLDCLAHGVNALFLGKASSKRSSLTVAGTKNDSRDQDDSDDQLVDAMEKLVTTVLGKHIIPVEPHKGGSGINPSKIRNTRIAVPGRRVPV